MPRNLFRLLLAFAALAFVAGACSSSDDDDDATDEDAQEEVDETTDDEEADEGEDDAEDSSDDDNEGSRGDAIDLLEQAGFPGESAECIADSLSDQGIDLGDLERADMVTPSSDMTDALAQAGADCVEEISEGGLPEGSTDLSNPDIYDAFVEGFASTSGLGIETAECIADYMLDNDIDPAAALEDGGAAVQEALASCQ